MVTTYRPSLYILVEVYPTSHSVMIYPSLESSWNVWHCLPPYRWSANCLTQTHNLSYIGLCTHYQMNSAIWQLWTEGGGIRHSWVYNLLILLVWFFDLFILSCYSLAGLNLRGLWQHNVTILPYIHICINTNTHIHIHMCIHKLPCLAPCVEGGEMTKKMGLIILWS